jgi:hypothetical protein
VLHYGCMDKICPTCLQPWPQCICVIPIKRGDTDPEDPPAKPGPHPILSIQLMKPTVIRMGRGLLSDPPKEFCPECSMPWQSCRCAGRRI